MNTKIVTYTGKIFDLQNPKPEQVCIEDIAHSLAHQCRYTGHTRWFYSVAQHCILMAENSDLPGDPMQKLMHDADEAYVGDIARPWKRLLHVLIPETKHFNGHDIPVKNYERKIQEVIGTALGINLEPSAEVKESDIRMMATETRDLMPLMPQPSVWDLPVDISPVEEIIESWHPIYTERKFLSLYKKLRS